MTWYGPTLDPLLQLRRKLYRPSSIAPRTCAPAEAASKPKADHAHLRQISFTFILPLFPRLLEFYRDSEAPALLNGGPPTLLQRVISGLNSYKASFARPIESRYDIVLLGGAMGSLFS